MQNAGGYPKQLILLTKKCQIKLFSWQSVFFKSTRISALMGKCLLSSNSETPQSCTHGESLRAVFATELQVEKKFLPP